jgi:hypothetical protein
MVAFLGSFKNTESLSPELRESIQARTQLERYLTNAMSDGRVILITGSAGSGKTHLLESTLSDLPNKVEQIAFGETAKSPHVLSVADATELTAEERLAAVSSRAKNRVSTVIAINEGPLRESASIDPQSTLAEGVRLLHESQRGITHPFDNTKPTLIDMGAFDPLEAKVVGDLLNLPVLAEIVAESPCSCVKSDCPRRLAWLQLKSEPVRNRISDLVRLVRLLESDWLFRDIWDFIADIVLEGDCQADPPTSPWFWRLFFGESRLSRALLDVANPARFALPQTDSRIFFGDWASDFLELIDNAELQLVSQPQANHQRFTYVKTQVVLLGKGPSLDQRVLRVQEGSLAGAVMARQVGPVLRAMNEYMVFGLKDGAATKLDLVLDHVVRRPTRRASRINGVLKLGEASSAQFELRNSAVVVNHPEGHTLTGKRHFLVHDQTGASFELSPDRVQLLYEGRSLRLSDRNHADLAWDLTRFFEEILRTNTNQNEFASIVFHFDTLSSSVTKFTASANDMIIELAE